MKIKNIKKEYEADLIILHSDFLKDKDLMRMIETYNFKHLGNNLANRDFMIFEELMKDIVNNINSNNTTYICILIITLHQLFVNLTNKSIKIPIHLSQLIIINEYFRLHIHNEWFRSCIILFDELKNLNSFLIIIEDKNSNDRLGFIENEIETLNNILTSINE